MNKQSHTLQDVMKAMGDLGWTGMQLSALDAENGSGGSAASSGMGASSAAGGSAPEADEALLLAALREQLTQQLRQQPAGQQPEPRLMACLKVGLASLLRARSALQDFVIHQLMHFSAWHGYKSAHATQT